MGLRLHLGCGARILDGWINADINTIAERNAKLGREEEVAREIDLRHDLLKPLPYGDGTVDLIYNEHLIEHFSFVDGRRMLRDWLRVLRSGGVLRLATPSIEGAIELYGDPGRFAELNAAMARNIQTRGVFLNQLFRSFGHRFVHDEETLTRSLNEIGYVDITTREVGRSSVGALRDLETRIYGRNSLLTSLCIGTSKPPAVET